jgi:uncharacterized protein (DUF736 family)|tara:strand:- start:1493 stop:1717 length:225 start_codon:yes stop_codon:yes gene_type:complete
MENKDMTGVLFPVENKQSDKHPNLTGNVVIKGEKFYLSAWTNTSKNGKKYISLKANAEQKKQDNTPTQNDDIPF